MIEPFTKPRLQGERFSHHSIPLEVLKDFAAFEEMLLEVAKREYLLANPGRQRTPRGFARGLELHLAGIEEGSAILSIVLTGLSLLSRADSEYIVKAERTIIDAIASIEKGLQPQLPPEFLRYFDRFGRSLQDGESISFPIADGGQASLTPEIRQKLLRASQADEWTEEMVLKGRISEADQADRTFELELRNGSKLKAPLDEQHLSTILGAFSGYREGCLVAVRGIIKRDRSGRPKSFEAVEHITQLDPLDVEIRLEALSSLKSGWLDGEGVAPDPEASKSLAEDFERFFGAELPLPHLYPTAEGGIQAEWTIDEWEISLEIDLQNRIARYQALHLGSDEHEDLEYDLSKGEAEWMRLNDALRKLQGMNTA